MAESKTSWWVEFATGPRRDVAFMDAAKKAFDSTPDGAPVIEEGCQCTICRTDFEVNIRDWKGYSLEAVKTIVGPLDNSIVRDNNGWRVFFCVPCAQSWLFPYMERYVGYTYERIMTEVFSMTDKWAPSKTKPNPEQETKN